MIVAVYFSPAGSTRQVVSFVAECLSQRLGIPYKLLSYTLPRERDQWPALDREDIVLWGTPVYAGRIPNKTLDFVKTHIVAPGAKGICVAVYGNRNYDNALAEMADVMRQGGILPVAAAAVVARHVFSPQTIAPGRPAEADYAQIADWCRSIVFGSSQQSFSRLGRAKASFPSAPGLTKTFTDKAVVVPGNAEAAYYTPKGVRGEPAKFLKAVPEVDADRCDGCGRCAEVCPMGSIGTDGVGRPLFEGVCIKCHACVSQCPCHALSFRDPAFLSHRQMLEDNYSAPASNQFFV